MKRMALIALALSSVVQICSSAFTCVPEDDCMSLNGGDQVPNPEDCQSFYYCLGDGTPAPSPTSCPDGQYFDTTTGVCVVTESCDPDFCSTGGIGQTTCSISCSQVDYIPVAGDCSSYIDCVDPLNPILTCPESNQYFNGKQCVSNADQCCYVCTPLCPKEGDNILVSDPNNCYGYVLCLSGGEMVFSNCPENQTFDPVREECSAEYTTCRNYCLGSELTTDSTNTDTTTSTDVTTETTTPTDIQTEITTSTVTSTESTQSTVTSTDSTESTVTSTDSTESTVTSTDSPESTVTFTGSATSTDTSTETTTSTDTATETTMSSDTTTETTMSSDTTTETTMSSDTTTETTMSSDTTTETTMSSDTTTETTMSSDTTTETTTSTDTTTETTISTETTTETTTQSSCVDNFVCPVNVPNGAFPYCNSCIQEYYKCSNGVTTLEMCADGFVFDYTINYCVLVEECPYYSTSTSATYTGSTVDPGNCDTSFTCPISDGAFPYCETCIDTYYECNNGFASMEKCSDGFVFDYTINYCVREGSCPYFP